MGGEEMTYRSAWAGNVVLTVFQLPEATGHEPSTSVQFLCPPPSPPPPPSLTLEFNCARLENKNNNKVHLHL